MRRGLGARPAGASAASGPCEKLACDEGAVIRGDSASRRLSLIFTGGSFADGGEHIRRVLCEEGGKAGQAVEDRRPGARAAVASEVVGPGRIEGDEDDVGLGRPLLRPEPSDLQVRLFNRAS
jgi:hypothetical protein